MKLAEILGTGVTSWADVHAALVPLNKADEAKIAGFLLEDFAYGYFKQAPEYRGQLANVWREKDLPEEIRERLTLAKRDHGVDLVLEDNEGRLLAVQVKFKTKEDALLGWTKDRLSSWLAESDEADGLVLFTNASGVDDATAAKADKKGFRLVSQQDLVDLDAGTITNIILASANKRTKKRELWHPFATAKRPGKNWDSRQRAQLKAIQAVTKGFETADKGQLILPCGTGKTFTGVRIIETLKAKRTLVIVPTLDLVRQTMKTFAGQMKTPLPYVSVCSENDIDTSNEDGVRTRTFDVPGLVTTDARELTAFRNHCNEFVVFSTYQSLHAVIEAGMEFDLTIADEAHKVAISRLSDFTLVHRDELKTKRRLFMTATPRVLSQHARKGLKAHIGDQDPFEVVACMSDESTFGKPFFEMNFADAIERGILTEYKIFIPVIDDPEVWDHIESRDYVEDTDAFQAAVSHTLERIMKKNGLNHALTFHSTVKRAQAFQAIHAKRTRGVKTFHVNGTQTSNKRVTTLNKFAASKKAIVTNARCLTEGVDVPAIDTVCFVDPRHSKVDIVQAIGRAMRLADGKEYGAIVLPVFVQPGQDEESAVEDSIFDNVHHVLQAMMDQDERLVSEIMAIKTGEGAKRPTTKPRVVFDYGTEHVVLEGFADRLLEALTTRVFSVHSWELKFEEWKRVKPLKSRSENPRVYDWASNQRGFRRKGLLSQKRINMLDAEGFRWNPKRGGGKAGSTLNREIARAIFLDTRPTSEITKEYGLGSGAIRAIQNRQTWQKESADLVAPKRQKRKLSEGEVLGVYNSALALDDIAAKYGISRSLVGYIRSGKYYSEITGGKKTPAASRGKKLTTENAVAIYKDPRSLSAIAKEYGVSISSISNIKLGKVWSHATGHKADSGE